MVFVHIVHQKKKKGKGTKKQKNKTANIDKKEKGKVQKTGKKRPGPASAGAGMLFYVVYNAFSKRPAMAVRTRLKPAQEGRWVASAAFPCFQLPTEAGRPAIHASSQRPVLKMWV